METLLFVLILINILLVLTSVSRKFLAIKLPRLLAINGSSLVLSLSSMSFIAPPQNFGKLTKPHKPQVATYTPDYSESAIDSLKTLYGQNKELPEGYELQTLLALSHYPELKDVSIRFENRSIKTTMACQPDVKQMLKNGNRSYVIIIGTEKKQDGIQLADVPFNAQVGVIGHEIAHVLDYESKNVIQLVGTGFGYLFTGYKRRLEHHVDGLTISKGLGNQLYDWADFAMNKSNASEEYKAFKRSIYLSPETIRVAAQ